MSVSLKLRILISSATETSKTRLTQIVNKNTKTEGEMNYKSIFFISHYVFFYSSNVYLFYVAKVLLINLFNNTNVIKTNLK